MKPDAVKSSLEKMRSALYTDFPDVEKLRSSDKFMFIRQHRQMIIEFNDLFGDDKTREVFHLTPDTLWSIKNNDDKYNKHIPANQTTKMKAAMALELFTGIEKKLDHLAVRTEDITSLRREVRELKSEFNKFAEVTANQVVKALITPLLQGLMSQYGGGELEEGEEVVEDRQSLYVMSHRTSKRKNLT